MKKTIELIIWRDSMFGLTVDEKSNLKVSKTNKVEYFDGEVNGRQWANILAEVKVLHSHRVANEAKNNWDADSWDIYEIVEAVSGKKWLESLEKKRFGVLEDGKIVVTNFVGNFPAQLGDWERTTSQVLE